MHSMMQVYAEKVRQWWKSACTSTFFLFSFFFFYLNFTACHSFWAKSIDRWGKNRRSSKKKHLTTPASRTWFVSHVFGLVWFLFYGPSTHFRSFQAQSVNLATLFLGKLLGSLPVLSAYSFASNWQLLFLNQRKRENDCRNVFMTKSPWQNVPDVGIELGAACMPSELTSDRATAPCLSHMRPELGSNT